MPRLSKIGAAALAAFGWTSGAAVTADFLVVAGGGGAGAGTGGGGGAGGYRTGTASLNPTLSYTVTVGAGGTGSSTSGSGINGSSGTDSVFDTTTSTGGGGGGGADQSRTGSSGGSGGGAGTDTASAGSAGSGNTPSTNPSQGNNGGTCATGGSLTNGSAGGGGASAVGGNSTTSAGGNGGAGTASSITGSSVTYAGGGGGSGNVTGTAGTGGAGGGGNGAVGANNGSSGTANLGGGGGAGGVTNTSFIRNQGGNGGSGVVIISYVGAQQFGGGVVTSSGGNTIHTFTTSGTLSPLSSLTASSLVVAGGGGGGSLLGGGGGAGGYRTGSGITIDTNSIYVVTVGAGGAGAIASGNGLLVGAKGGSSTFLAITSAGGGEGGSNNATVDGQLSGGGSGGSGGGAGPRSTTAAAGNTPSTSPSQGNNGGIQGSFTVNGGSGGGGASAVGGNLSGTAAGSGGAGTANSISGSSVTYSGGGGGGGRASLGGTAGSGGAGGGGSGTADNSNGGAGTNGLGGGGGGGGFNGTEPGGGGGNGGSGVVIISYAGSTQLMAGGTVTVAGGNVIHTFTSSGYLTPIVLVNNSLRFRQSATAWLSRTPSVSGSGTTFTWSGWIKRGLLGGSNVLTVFTAGTADAALGALYFDNSTNKLSFLHYNGAYNWNIVGTPAYRDPSAWYHVVAVVDTTQATASNRIKLYVNGVEITAFDTASYPTPNYSSPFFNQSGIAQFIGRWGTWNAGNIFDGYMAEINFIDGQALTPNSFGTSNGLGVWQPIRYGGSYGTNGFYLPFNAGTLSYAGLFNGSSQYLSLTANSSLQFGTGDFTVEGWYYQNGTVTYGNIFSTTLSFGTTGGLRLSTGPNNNTFQVATGGSGLLNASVAFSASRWNHFAVVRSSGVTTLYQNGVSVGSASDSNSYTANTFVIGWVDGSGSSAYLLNGLLSNFRVVKGTAVYTANFTPSTSPLTAISGTSLLTLQNATIIDNSTNAFSITNNGTVTTGQTYPCSTALFNDQGPAGNNWTPNNISGQFGSTLDTMTDVPTLTSATTANYAVLNPLDKGGTVNPKNGNLGFANTAGTYNIVRSTVGITSGKWYFEYTIVDSASIGGGSTSAGLVRHDSVLSGKYLGQDTNTLGSVASGTPSLLLYNGTNKALSSGLNSFSVGAVIQYAYDADAGKLWVGVNNSWDGGNNPSTGSTPTLSSGFAGSSGPWFFAANGLTSPDDVAVNFGQQPFSYTPPTGFVALNTFNLPTPTIGATASTTANKYFDVLLHNGNGGSQSITGLNFAPDFWWVKSRNILADHCLFDQIRGANSSLFSDLTLGENNNWTGQSFNSNGVTADAAYSYQTNGAGYTFVDWFWKANGAGSSNTQGSIISTVSANTTSGFSIVTYTGNGTNGSTVGHGLGVTPSMVIVKSRTSANDWAIYHSSLTAGNMVFLNTTGQSQPITSYDNGGIYPVSSSTFTTAQGGITQNNVNGSGNTYVAYCFAQVAGYSAFGSYVGNDSADGVFIYTGFRPAFILYKKATGIDGWVIFDTKRNTYNVVDTALQPNTSGAEASSAAGSIDILSNGFKQRNANNIANSSSFTYIYMAFAESPFKYANAR